MANKRPRTRRSANVVVPLDLPKVCRSLFRGIGGTFEGDLIAACAEGFVPFERDVDPSAYSSADSFRADYLGAVMLSKYDDERSSSEKARKALEKFSLGEEQCRRTNRNFANFVGGALEKGVTVEACLYTASRKIQRLLGHLDLDEIASGFGFGAGASTRLPRRRADTWYKFQGKPETTTNCMVFAHAVFLHAPLWLREVLNESEQGGTPYTVVRANHVITVPKNAKIDRVIAVEPDLNLFVQKGFGSAIRRRLKKVGIDLDDQTVNQRLAYEGSLDGSLATLDLSNASDTVSRGIVEQLLPPDWLLALEQCRSPEGVLPSGEIVRYQKFSSMGNGFTFELESLIFWALCKSVSELLDETDVRVSVYGDDIIVPSTIADPVMRLLEFCGFTINRKKSFWSGPFRESCGKHYFLGTDVTPFYVRKSPRRLSDVFLLHNNIVRWSDIEGFCRDGGQEGGLFDCCETLKNAVPVQWRRPRIPLGYGDGAFVGSFDECVPSRAPRGFCGWRVEVLSEPRVLSNRGGTGRLLKSLWGLEGKTQTASWVVMGEPNPFRFSDASRGRVSDLLRRRTNQAVPGVSRPDGSDGAGLGAHYRPDQSRDRLSRSLKLTKVMYELPMTKRARIQKILVPQWADLGPWI